MEAARRQTAEEERRLKLLEYLAAKGKLKLQNNCKPYLKDCTNLQSKRPQESAKQKNASYKGSHLASESSRSKTSNARSLPYKPSSGKLPTQQMVAASRPENKTLSRNAPPSRGGLLRTRPDHAGRTLQPSTVPHSIKLKRSDKSDVALTVVYTKTQHGEKSEICVMDNTSPAWRDQHASGLCSGIQAKGREQNIAQSKKIPLTKTITQTTKTNLHDAKPQPPAGTPMSVASAGHIRIVSRVSMSGSKSVSERSFLIKTSRNDGAKQPLDVRKEPVERKSQKTTCPTKPSSAIPGASSNIMANKKVSTGPVSAPKIKPHSSDIASKHMANSQKTHTLNKPIAPRKSTGPTGWNKAVDRSKNEYAKQNGIGGDKQQGVTAETKKSTTKASNLTATDSACRPQTPRMTVEDRRKKLEEWLNSKGKTYKRPPMVLPPKRPPTAKKHNPCDRSLWEGIEEEEELLCLSIKISQTLSECLELIEKGVPGEDIHAALDKVPEAKKFAKYWVCKARLLEREGIDDVIDVYKQGVQFGATPIEELREVVFDIMKNTSKKTKVVTFGPLPAEKEEVENDIHEDIPLTPYTNRTEEMKTTCTGAGVCDQGSAVKLQITSLSSKKKIPGSGQEWKRLTPVRRSVRIHQSASQYPEVVQEHDTVVSCLDDLLDQADTEAYMYVRNEALPEEADHGVLSLKKDPTEDQHEGPV
ncbi:cytoskeleton-associated protein 2-like [Dendropsophus ebraccatus]|uniref:cytoskeleton-associated protein 2-like n=1 Tax=Dendropsophus ebraccatus TaxID=150705 RepID=UPI003831DC17